MKSALFAAAVLAMSAPAAFAQMPMGPGAPPMPGAPAAPISRLTASMVLQAPAKLTVSTPGWADGGDIPFEYTQYRTNTFPGLAWTGGPAATKSYAVIMQDTDGMRGIVLHWTLFNIPATVTSLDRGMAPTGNPPGSGYGPNFRGAAQPYTGPRTGPGPKHHYHLQVFALDTTIDPNSTAKYDDLFAQMKGHVLASGEVVGLGSVDPEAPPPAPPAPRPAVAP